MRVLAAVGAVVMLAGCGSRSTARGRAVFEASCARCHTLAGRDTNAPGGDLRVGRLTVREIESFVSVMPVDPPLGRADTRAVARFVARR